MENNEEKILKEIEKDVNSNAELVKAMVEGETAALREDQISFFKKSLKKETETYLEKELSDLRLYAATKSSRDKMNTKKNLLALRQNLADELFAEVRGDLEKFTASSDYAVYLEKNLTHCEVTEKGVFLCRPEHCDLMRKVLNKAGLHNKVEEKYLGIGGFLYRDVEQGLEYSCVLEERLDDQIEWFRNHSGFRIVESGDQA